MNIYELEARFKEIDERAKVDSVDVRLEGDSESSGNLSVSVREKAQPLKPHADLSGILDSTPVQTETLLDVDLSEVEISDEYVDDRIRAAFAREGSPDLPGAILRQIGATKNWELMEEYPYSTTLDGTEFRMTALKGFIYDRASVPPIVWVITKDSLGSVPPLFHDLLYRNGGVLPESEAPPYHKFGQVTPSRIFVRKEVDDLFRELAKKSGVTKWRADAAYDAVRLFGGPSWKS